MYYVVHYIDGPKNSDACSAIARKAYACFGMKIYYHDLYRKSSKQEQAVGASFCESLDDLLAAADCVVLATPFGGSKLIARENLARFKRGAKFVNIARGALVDEIALVDALKSGQLSAAGLDVHEHEPNVNKELARLRNVTYVLVPWQRHRKSDY
jgi:lactate dehydrogenase-like 2-hydroxyacid dehydrogenase